MNMFYVVTYDISSTLAGQRRYRRLVKKLKNYGKPVQYSVYECILNTREQKEKMVDEISAEIEPKEDSIRIYRLDSDYLKDVQIIGRGIVRQIPEFMVF